LPRPYQLTPAIVASSVGAGVLCLAAEGIGRTFRLHAERPGPERNTQLDLPSGAAHTLAPVASKSAVIRVDIAGPLEQRAGFHDVCGGWSDGHDAVAERLCAAFLEGDALLVLDGPGGAAAGIEQSVRRALAAKAAHGRRCIGFVDEQCGSAHAWWALALCDELFLPPTGQIGSIGARAGHLDRSEAMAKAGERVTFFAWPNAGKVALASELPLSEVGRERGARDVALFGETFCAAVCASPIALRYGLDRDRVIALGADMLTGQAAVDEGLADGVATLEETTAYALRLAETKAQNTSSRAVSRARGDSMKDKTTGAIRAEGDEDEAPPSSQPEGAPSSRAPGREIPTKCAGCAVENPPAAKYCMGCGASMATAPIESEEPAPPAPPAAAVVAVPSRLASSAPFAEIFRLPADASMPAQKSAALDMRQVFDLAAQITGQGTAEGILGGLVAMSADAGDAASLRSKLTAINADRARTERWALAKRLVACGAPGWDRGRVYEDVVTESGERKLDERGNPMIKLAPIVAEMKLGTFRGMVEGFERNKTPANPFEPDEARAREASRGAPIHGDTAARIERAKKHPKVIAMSQRPGQNLTLDQLATAFVASDFDL